MNKNIIKFFFILICLYLPISIVSIFREEYSLTSVLITLIGELIVELFVAVIISFFVDDYVLRESCRVEIINQNNLDKAVRVLFFVVFISKNVIVVSQVEELSYLTYVLCLMLSMVTIFVESKKVYFSKEFIYISMYRTKVDIKNIKKISIESNDSLEICTENDVFKIKDFRHNIEKINKKIQEIMIKNWQEREWLQ